MEAPRLGVKSELRRRLALQPQPHLIQATSLTPTQLVVVLDSQPAEQDQGSNLHPRGNCVGFLTHRATLGAPKVSFVRGITQDNLGKDEFTNNTR